jgi:hypothetical protein
MNEIELLRNYRAEVSGPAPEAREAARSRLETAIQRELAPGVEAPQAPRRRDFLRRRRVLVLAGGVAAAAIATVLALTLSSGPGQTQNAAAEALRKAATVAAAQPNHPPRSGQYAYTESRNAYITVHPESPQRKSWSFIARYKRQAWIGPDNSGRLREFAEKPLFLSDTDRRLCRADHASACTSHWQGQGGRISSQNYGPGKAQGPLAYIDTTHLPTDSDRLYQLLRHASVINGPPYRREKATVSDAQVFWTVGELLSETYAPPQVRAALYRATSNLPRVQYLGQTQNSVGEEGVGVAYTSRGQRNELIFDPNTSELIGIRQVLVDPGKLHLHAPAGSVIGDSSFVSRGVVNSTSSLPGGGRVGSPGPDHSS